MQMLNSWLVLGLVSVVMMETAESIRSGVRVTASLERAPAVTSGGVEVSARARFVLPLLHNGKNTSKPFLSAKTYKRQKS